MEAKQHATPSHVPSAEAIRESYAECNRISREANSSFYLAFFGLRKPKRNALCALYAFNRLVDNISDEPGDLDSKRRGLARWRGLLDEAAAWNTGGHPILPALADTMSRFEIPTRYFHDLILGAEMDLTIDSYATFDRLAEYCYRVAGTVGLTCTHVFGFHDPKAPDLAERLGLAFQLTNIIRDVRSDYEMGRCTFRRRIWIVSAAARRISPARCPRRCKACSSLKQTAPGGCMRKARNSRIAWMPTAAPPCGPDPHLQHFARAHRRA